MIFAWVYFGFFFSSTQHHRNGLSVSKKVTSPNVQFSYGMLIRGYSQPEIVLATSKVSLKGRTQLVHEPQRKIRTKKLPVVFSTTYNPAVNHHDLKRVICKYWWHIQSNEQLIEIFPAPPLIAYKKARNIRKCPNKPPSQTTLAS